jgi:hypothetical protein
MRKYRELDQRLAAEGQDSQLVQQAQTFLHAGQLAEAGTLLDQLSGLGHTVKHDTDHHLRFSAREPRIL